MITGYIEYMHKKEHQAENILYCPLDGIMCLQKLEQLQSFFCHEDSKKLELLKAPKTEPTDVTKSDFLRRKTYILLRYEKNSFSVSLVFLS
jgi:hypothetical protein